MNKRGWGGLQSCNFCNEDESVDHLFLKCDIARIIWFWMGECKNMFNHWRQFTDIIDFANNLSKKDREAFLTVISGVCWSIWTTRNNITFQNANVISSRNIIVLTCVLLNYWAGNMKEETSRRMSRWMPQALDEIPLQVMRPMLQITA